MSRRRNQFALCLFLLLFAAFFCFAADETKAVSLSSLPAAAQKTIQSHLGGDKLGEIERVEEDGEVSFDVTITKGETEHSLSVGEDGTLLSLEVE
ncbi:MAG: hypothetical protein EPO07_14665, partial [Verrucomicrobia bacterium]